MQRVVNSLTRRIKQRAAYAMTRSVGHPTSGLRSWGTKVEDLLARTNMNFLKGRTKTRFSSSSNLFSWFYLDKSEMTLVSMRERVRCEQLIFVQEGQMFKLPVLLLILDTSHGWGFYP